MRPVAAQRQERRGARLTSAFPVDGNAIQEILNFPRTIERPQDAESRNVDGRLVQLRCLRHCASGIRLVSGNANITAAAATSDHPLTMSAGWVSASAADVVSVAACQ
jgi:hypothetical protein